MRIAGKVIAGALSTVVFAGTAYGFSTLSSLEDITRSDVIGTGGSTRQGEQPADGALDILLVGRDARKDPKGNPLPQSVLQELRVGDNGDDLTDTLIVMRIPNGQQEVKAFSIPRDSYVPLPGGGKGKINAAFGRGKAAAAAKLRASGETDKDKIEQESLTAGRQATRQAVEDLTGVTIDHYAEVNLLSFSEISKAVGGVEVCLKQATKDENSGADFPAGKQRLSGGAALAFVRQRDNLPGTDFGRMRRQQVFLAALAHQVLSAGTLADPGKLNDLIDAVKRSVVLDQSWDVLDFVGQMRGVSGGGIQFTTVPVVNPDYRYDRSHPSATAVQVDPVQVKAFAAGLIGAPPPAAPPGAPKAAVEVSNAGEAAGLAARVADVLKGKGFAATAAGNAPSQRTSIVRYPAALAAEGAEVAKELGGLSTKESADVPAGHIQVVLGKVYAGPGVSDGGSAAGVPVKTDQPQPVTSEGDNCID
ncbi:LCP family protein [Amycolatopsis echigonensis]|uniref:LCP family protein n=1 Tax=Amycolatopsis echigonensis TaxID=2576905 RepID=A0A8E1W5U4_9PSEU|nr:LCP family protein [Amycolatopsis echigonensis]MBB2504140.1 LCP family protein [Amycolatopsis echigonensis]